MEYPKHGLWDKIDVLSNSSSTAFPSCVTLDKSLNFNEIQFLLPKMGIIIICFQSCED